MGRVVMDEIHSTDQFADTYQRQVTEQIQGTGQIHMDIVVPSYRLNAHYLQGIIALPHPEWLSVHYYIIADNPLLSIPPLIKAAAENNSIHLHLNQCNKGASVSRNEGIRMSRSPWILLLDDDIIPADDLLFVYAAAIRKYADVIGYAGTTRFPPASNAATAAMQVSGLLDGYSVAEKQKHLVWSSSSNVLLRRDRMDKQLFDGKFAAAEDIDFLTRNSLLFERRYIAVPEAIVLHPWWDNGALQTRRMFHYGEGVAQLARKKPTNYYIYYDLPNSAETLLVLSLLLPLAWWVNWLPLLATLAALVLLADFFVCWSKTVSQGKGWSPLVAGSLLWNKNCYEFGRLFSHIHARYWPGFAQRIDLRFENTYPPDFPVDKWKWGKMGLIAWGVLLWVL